MYSAIQTGLSNIQMQIGFATEKWMGLFTPLNVLIGVQSYIREQVCMIFYVHDDGRLIFTPKETNLFEFCLFA